VLFIFDAAPAHQNQGWEFKNGSLISTLSGLCVGALFQYEGANAQLLTCDDSPNQQWVFNTVGVTTEWGRALSFSFTLFPLSPFRQHTSFSMWQQGCALTLAPRPPRLLGLVTCR